MFSGILGGKIKIQGRTGTTYQDFTGTGSLNSENVIADNKMNIVGDKVILSKEGNTYNISFNMILPDGRAISMEYEVNDKHSIPNSLLVKQVLLGEVLIEQTTW